MAIPVLANTPWRPLFTPATGVHVNDHCVVQAQDGRWHVFGITKPTHGFDPQAERYFCHGSGHSLAEGNFRDRGKACDFGNRAWAPTLAFNGEYWVMLWGPDHLRAAISDDPRLEHWQEVPCSVTGGPLGAVARDGMVVRLDDDTWLLYATGKRGHDGAIAVCVSEDLLNWRFVRFALTTIGAPKQPPWGATESPYVFKKDDAFWLSMTYTTSGDGPAGYHNTLLFRSANPFDFGNYSGDVGEVAARLYAHAPEYLQDPASGQWYITSCGWHGDQFGTVIPGSVAIRELEWV
jgi:beta-fructofuranosidase